MDAPVAPILLVALVAAGAIAAAVYAAHREKQRRESLRALAQELGGRFDPRRDHTHDDRYAHFEVFRRGHSRAACNTITAPMTVLDATGQLVLGDFRYKRTSGSGKSRRTVTYRFSYCILHLPVHDLPDLLIRPEGVFDRLADVFGGEDIDFELDDFSRAFLVKCTDRKFAYDVIDPRMMEFLLAARPPAIDIEHGRCLLADGGRRWTPDQFRARLRFLEHFFDRWPDHVVRRLGDGTYGARR